MILSTDQASGAVSLAWPSQNYDSQTSRPPSEEKQLSQRLGESRSNATSRKRERHAHTLKVRGLRHTQNDWMQLVIVFHLEMKWGEIHLHLIKGFFSIPVFSSPLFMTSCPCAARFIYGMGGTEASCMPYIYTARANWHDTLPCAHSNYIHWRLLQPDRLLTIKMPM